MRDKKMTESEKEEKASRELSQHSHEVVKGRGYMGRHETDAKPAPKREPHSK